ncbi:anthranilate synthase component I [Bacillus solimangrovi]|uniref:Anthranilate synthase component 1 n=1 Tax=Bacillus solimangrovi TaxID=1305675 RepID=A0A1E5LH92_9BACI|nr:anthranilate synthase component I [Bacillus solimangrovi]OEH93449.1 anthranilate synthase component I [Bacillus solimangrovi]
MTSTQYSTFLETSNHYLTIPVVDHFFSDTLTPIEIFQSLQDEACYLLESKDELSTWSRYSFIGLNPFLILFEEDGRFIATMKDEQIANTTTLQDAYTTVIKKLKVKVPELELPFSGGAVGYIGYDAISLFEKVSPHPKDTAQNKRVYLQFCETILAFDHVKKELSLVHYIRLAGDEGEAEKENYFHEAKQKIASLIEKIEQSPRLPSVQHAMPAIEEDAFNGVRSNYEKEQFLKDVERIKEYILAGDVFQTVLSQRFSKEVTVSGFELYRMLRMVNPSPYLFYLKADNKEYIGSSPERLIQIQDKHLEIHPIAGTRRRGANSDEDRALGENLLQDEKERAEHYMLVDLARNDIGRVANYGSVETPVLMELTYFSHVMHLISKVTGTLNEEVSPLDALISAFPAGTVSGAPKIRAMEILNELEPTVRQAYAGAICYIGFDGNIDSCITIRTMTKEGSTVHVQAGAGIVADSVPENEFEETQNKARALLATIQQAERMFSTKGGRVRG